MMQELLSLFAASKDAVSKGLKRVMGINAMETAASINSGREVLGERNSWDIFRTLYEDNTKHRVSLHQPLLHFLGQLLQAMTLLRVSVF